MFGIGKSNDNDREYFAIYDSKVRNYRDPILAFNREDLIREIENLMSSPKEQRNPLVMNAEDFSLFKVGAWDSKKGEIKPCVHEHVINFIEVRSMIHSRLAAMPPNPVFNQKEPTDAQA